jgi:LytR cell envelope-related transcriptional attenuator
MAHTAPPEGSHRRLESILGVLLLLVGVAVAVVAVMALDHPKGKTAANSTQTRTASASASTSASASASKSKTSASASKTSAASTPTPTPTAADSSPSSSTAGTGRLPLVVLNNTSDVTASTAAATFEQGGWTVSDTSTFSGDIVSTAAYYDPDVAGAQAAAEALQQQFPAIKRIKEKFEGLPQGPIVVVLTSDYS